MTLSITHSTVADLSFSATGATAWDATHSLTGVVDVAQGGTGATTAVDAANALLPSQTGNTGKVLGTNGTNTLWVAPANTGVTSVAAASPVTSTGGATPTIAMPAATNSVNGYLTSTDWNTFNSKGSGTVTSVALANGIGISVTGSPITSSGTITVTNTAPDQTVTLTNGTGISVTGTYPNFTITNTSPSSGGTVTSVTGTAPVVSSGGNTPAISMAAATTSTNGYLTSTDWNTFNGKGSGTVTSVAALTLGTSGTDLNSTVATGTSTPVITLNVPTASAANRGALSAADWSTFNNKQPAGSYLTTVTVDSPLTGAGTAASHLSIPAATASINGYLTSTDWNTFNSKQVTLVSGTNIKTINGSSVLGSGDLVVSGSFSGGTLTSPLILAAGTATNGTEPLRFQTGVIAASPAAGTMEYDGVTLLATPQSGNRGVVPAVHYITQVNNYTTPIGTANTLKQMFNATTSGSMTASANTTYFFECMFNLSSMSASSGNFQFGLLGTATVTNIMYMAIANKTALTVQTASSHTFGTVKTAVVISAANTTTTGYALIKGKIVVSTAGTIIPAYATSVAAASVVNAGAHFIIWEAGTNTEVEIGNWV